MEEELCGLMKPALPDNTGEALCPLTWDEGKKFPFLPASPVPLGPVRNEKRGEILLALPVLVLNCHRGHLYPGSQLDPLGRRAL